MRKANQEEIAAKKHERFVRIATARVNTLVNAFEKLGNCASKTSYEYTDEEVTKILEEVDRQVETLRERFNGKKAFSLKE